jgi:hypothetical protein
LVQCTDVYARPQSIDSWPRKRGCCDRAATRIASRRSSHKRWSDPRCPAHDATRDTSDGKGLYVQKKAKHEEERTRVCVTQSERPGGGSSCVQCSGGRSITRALRTGSPACGRRSSAPPASPGPRTAGGDCAQRDPTAAPLPSYIARQSPGPCLRELAREWRGVRP